MTVLEVLVATAVTVWMFLAIDGHLDQQAAMVRLMEAKLAARQAAAGAARHLLAGAKPAAPGYAVRVEPLGAAGPGVARVRVVATAGTTSDAVEVVVRE